MKFGDVREILDKYTIDCKDCECREFEEDEVDDGIYPYNTCSLDCSTYYAKKIKEEILQLLDKEKIETDSISMIPCTLQFKGICKVLPEKAEDGDTYVIMEHVLQDGYGWTRQTTFYWYDNKWNYIENPPECCRIKYV